MDYEFPIEEMNLVCEAEQSYISNKELERAWTLIDKTNCNLFLTGRAGTGKTTFLKKLREESSKRMVVLAPTGVAAINAQGSTIHSFFQLPFSIYIPGRGFVTDNKKFLNISRMKKRLVMSLSLLVIDEISMVRPDTLDAIDWMLRRLRGSEAPFGGLQLLLIGDLRQLPPVIKAEEWEMLKDHYGSPYFYDSNALKKTGFQTVELTTVYRQNDAAFLDILNAIRDGNASQDTLQAINGRYRPGFNPADSEGYIRLTTHNRLAENINMSRLAALDAPEFLFEAQINGKFPESSFPADQLLRLKEGAQVMFVKNDIGVERKFYNGMIGTIVSISEDKIYVQPVDKTEIIEVEQAEWEITQYELEEASGKIMQVPVGTFRQFPLQLAWAVTIHKSQGLTFDRAIIDAARSFAPGQTYVALSRCRTLEGLVLETPLPASAVITDSAVNDFIQYYASHTPSDSDIEVMKQNYAVSLMCELLDFDPLRNAFNAFYRTALECLVPIYPDKDQKLTELKNIVENDLRDVSLRFLKSYSPDTLGSRLADNDSPLRQRLRNGCMYFFEKMKRFSRILHELPEHIDNSEYAKRLENTYTTLKDHVGMKTTLFQEFLDIPFSVEAFLNIKAAAILQLDRTQQKVKFKQTANKATKKAKPKGYSTFETFRLYSEGKNIEEIAKERNLSPATIAGHIADLIKMQKIAPEEVVDPEMSAFAKKILEDNPGFGFHEWSESLRSHYEENTCPSYLHSILWQLSKS